MGGPATFMHCLLSTLVLSTVRVAKVVEICMAIPTDSSVTGLLISIGAKIVQVKNDVRNAGTINKRVLQSSQKDEYQGGSNNMAY